MRQRKYLVLTLSNYQEQICIWVTIVVLKQVCQFKVLSSKIWYPFYLRKVTKDFPKVEMKHVSLYSAYYIIYSAVYDLYVDKNAIKTEDMLNVHDSVIKKTKILHDIYFNILLAANIKFWKTISYTQKMYISK